VRLTRRRLLLNALGLGAATLARRSLAAAPLPLPLCTPRGLRKVALRPAAPIPAPLHPQSLARFVDPLPVPPLARSAGTRPDPEHPGRRLPYYRIAMREVRTHVHRDLPPVRCWSYGEGMPGPTFEVRSGQAILVEWANELPDRHFLPIDHTLHGAGTEVPEVRTVVHVHGARVPPDSDGYPEKWFTPGQSATYRYPNRQDACTLWYHDHTMGIERLNQYAGLLGAYLVRDETEAALKLPSGQHEIPLLLFDRLLDRDGQLQYPTSGIDGMPWVSEVYGDAILVNGTLYPYLEVEPRRYRFRVINASNSRFYYLALSNGQVFHQIGSDQGLLPAPVPMKALTLAPAERADLIIDFSAASGEQLILRSQAFELIQFRVAAGPGEGGSLPARLRPVPRIPRHAALRTRSLGLEEFEDPQTHAMTMLLNKTYWRQPVTEKPVLDTVEIWELVNFTGDIHPIHLHLVRFQVLERQPFDVDTYHFDHKMRLLGPPLPPGPEEMGWKDTVQAHPETITRIIVRFEGYSGRYVWHCHVLEHAANEMMRPFEVLPPHRG
jgi:spore coat protein A